MIRGVLFDTETTGLEWVQGDRVIEVAALELVNDLPTGRHFHALMDPERDIPEDATRIHGFTASHVAGKPRFAALAAGLLEFFGDGKLIAHNAPFDFGFLNAELAPGRSAARSARSGCSTRWRWQRPGFPACRTASTRCAGGSPSTSRPAPRTTRCSTAAAGRGLCRTDRRPAARLVAGDAGGAGRRGNLCPHRAAHAAADRAQRGRTDGPRRLGGPSEGAGMAGSLNQEVLGPPPAWVSLCERGPG